MDTGATRQGSAPGPAAHSSGAQVPFAMLFAVRWVPSGPPRRDPRGPSGEAEEREGPEIWILDHPRFTYVVLTVNREKRVEYVQGYLRKDRRPLRYRAIGDLGRAKQIGSYIYVWDLPARGGRPAFQVQARGADPRFPGSYLVAAATLGGEGRPGPRLR